MNTPLALAFIALCMVACTPQTPAVDHTGSSSSSSSITSVSDSYVGLSEADAEAKAAADGVPFRVVMRDGEPQMVTMDYRPGRINATVENDIVISYEVEGSETSQPSSSASAEYDQNSWRTMIPQFCMSFYDGCNTCHRLIDSDDAACTKKFCQQYEQPRCLDGQN